MLHNNHGNEDAKHAPASRQSVVRWYKSPVGFLLLGVALALGYYLWVYHSQHGLAFLPLIFFLACPLMHLLMHRDHKQESQAGAKRPS
jgi:hypothetical protein